jgi:hypothetical protein
MLPPVTATGVESLKASRLAALDRSALPPSITSNSKKELLVLEYVHNFGAQFTELFPRRRPLLLTAPNEGGTEKFVCTGVRPTQLPYREVRGKGGREGRAACLGVCASRGRRGLFGAWTCCGCEELPLYAHGRTHTALRRAFGAAWLNGWAHAARVSCGCWCAPAMCTAPFAMCVCLASRGAVCLWPHARPHAQVRAQLTVMA